MISSSILLFGRPGIFLLCLLALLRTKKLCGLSIASCEVTTILQLRSCWFPRLMSSGVTRISQLLPFFSSWAGLYTVYFSCHYAIYFIFFLYRADYNPDQYLWEKKFTLAGRAYQRQDLEVWTDKFFRNFHFLYG